MMAEQDNDETRACGLWLYMTRMLSVRCAMFVVSLSGLVYMLRGARECVGILVLSDRTREGKGLRGYNPFPSNPFPSQPLSLPASGTPAVPGATKSRPGPKS